MGNDGWLQEEEEEQCCAVVGGHAVRCAWYELIGKSVWVVDRWYGINDVRAGWKWGPSLSKREASQIFQAILRFSFLTAVTVPRHKGEH